MKKQYYLKRQNGPTKTPETIFQLRTMRGKVLYMIKMPPGLRVTERMFRDLENVLYNAAESVLQEAYK